MRKQGLENWALCTTGIDKTFDNVDDIYTTTNALHVHIYPTWGLHHSN